MNRVIHSLGVVLWLSSAIASGKQSRIIGGLPVAKGTHSEIVVVKASSAQCTAVVVGPQTLLTAAHCAPAHSEVTFQYQGVDYEGFTIRSPHTPQWDHDLSVIVVKGQLPVNSPFATLGGGVQEGDSVVLIGSGCVKPGGVGGIDGTIRMGTATVTGFQNKDFVTEGAALCFGDSGAAAYVARDGHYKLVGIGSKGNIKNVSYFTSLAIEESIDFLEQAAFFHQLKICGVNAECTGVPVVEPPMPNLSFTQELYRIEVPAGEDFEIDMEALLNDFPLADSVKWFIDSDAPYLVTLESDSGTLRVDKTLEEGAYQVGVAVRWRDQIAATIIHLDVK